MSFCYQMFSTGETGGQKAAIQYPLQSPAKLQAFSDRWIPLKSSCSTDRGDQHCHGKLICEDVLDKTQGMRLYFNPTLLKKTCEQI